MCDAKFTAEITSVRAPETAMRVSSIRLLDDHAKRRGTCDSALQLVDWLIYMCTGADRGFSSLPSTFERLAAEVGLAVECHIVQTGDGYELLLHRLVGRRAKRRPVFLMHGLFEESTVWLAHRRSSLAYRLVEGGYDVWLGNTRGNAYSSGQWGLWGSRMHSWGNDELASEDIAASVQAVLEVAHAEGLQADKVIFIGQSQGASSAITACSLREGLGGRLACLVLLAPPLCLQASVNPTLRLALKTPSLVYRAVFAFVLPIGRLVPNAIYLPIAKAGMRRMGFVVRPHDPDAAAITFRCVPSGSTSSPNLSLWFGMAAEGGALDVKTKQVTCPVIAYLGGQDVILDCDAITTLLQRLPDLHRLHVQPGFAHADFVWSADAPSIVYGQLLDEVDAFSG